MVARLLIGKIALGIGIGLPIGLALGGSGLLRERHGQDGAEPPERSG